MNLKVKHFIIILFSFVLLIATLYVPKPARDPEQMKHISFGYPFSFITQDFSQYNSSFSFFPRYQKFELRSEKAVIIDFSWIWFFASLVVVFLVIEIIIYVLENLYFKIRGNFEQDEKPKEN